MYGNRAWKYFEMKKLGEYHDLYLKSVHYFWMYTEIYEFYKILLTLGLAWQAALKKTKVKLELLTDINMLLMVEEGIRGGIWNTIHRYERANNRYMKDNGKNKESSYLNYWDVYNLYWWAMPQRPPVNNFEWIEGTSQFNEYFKQKNNEESDEGCCLEVDV